MTKERRVLRAGNDQLIGTCGMQFLLTCVAVSVPFTTLMPWNEYEDEGTVGNTHVKSGPTELFKSELERLNGARPSQITGVA